MGMKWFQNDSDAPDDPKVKPILRRGLRNPTPGQAAAGAMWLLWCFIANHGDGLPGEGINSERQPLDLQEMADECFFDNVEDLRAFLDLCAEKRLINPDRWKNEGVVFLPGMFKRADAYARSKGRTLPGAQPPAVQDGEVKARPGKRGKKRANAGKNSPGREPEAPELPLQDNTNSTSQTGQETSSSAGADRKVPTPEELVAVYNKHRTKGPKVTEITPDRRRKYLAALNLQPDLSKWAAAVGYADGQRWCNAPGTGDNPNYRLQLDSLVRPGNLVRMLERLEADRASPNGGGGGGAGGGNGRVAPTSGKYSGGDHGDGDGDGGETRSDTQT